MAAMAVAAASNGASGPGIDKIPVSGTLSPDGGAFRPISEGGPDNAFESRTNNKSPSIGSIHDDSLMDSDRPTLVQQNFQHSDNNSSDSKSLEAS